MEESRGDGDGVVVGGEYGDLVGQVALDHEGAFGDGDDSWLFEPVADDGIQGVVAAAEVVLGDVFGEGGAAFVGDFVAFASGVDLDDVDFFAGEEHAFVGDEADAFGWGEIAGGEAEVGGVVDDAAVGRAAEEGGGAAEDGHVLAIEPGVSAERGDHLVEE